MREIIFFDLETTGLDPRVHRPIEIAFNVLDSSSGIELAAYHSVVRTTENEWQQRDTTSDQIHGFSWEEVAQGNQREQVAGEIMALFKQYDVRRGRAFYLCQNPAFDRFFFSHILDFKTQEAAQLPYHWLDLASMYWAIKLKIERASPETILSLSKNSIADAYGIPPEKMPHRAENGVAHLIACYRALVGFGKPDNVVSDVVF